MSSSFDRPVSEGRKLQSYVRGEQTDPGSRIAVWSSGGKYRNPILFGHESCALRYHSQDRNRFQKGMYTVWKKHSSGTNWLNPPSSSYHLYALFATYLYRTLKPGHWQICLDFQCVLCDDNDNHDIMYQLHPWKLTCMKQCSILSAENSSAWSPAKSGLG